MANFSAEFQRVNVLVFMGHRNMKTNGFDCVPIKLYLHNKWPRQFGSQVVNSLPTPALGFIISIFNL